MSFYNKTLRFGYSAKQTSNIYWFTFQRHQIARLIDTSNVVKILPVFSCVFDPCYVITALTFWKPYILGKNSSLLDRPNKLDVIKDRNGAE